MTRQEVYRDMEETLGLVPFFFKIVPDATLEQDWQAFKNIQLAEGVVPNKEVFKVLRDAGYDDYLSIEAEGPDNEDESRRVLAGLTHLQKCLKEIGN